MKEINCRKKGPITYFVLSLLLTFHFESCTMTKDVQLQHSLANKQFIERMQEGSYEIVHPFQIRENSRERIGIDTREHFLNVTSTQHFRQVSFVIKSNILAHQRLKMTLTLTEHLLSLKTRIRERAKSGIFADENKQWEGMIENCFYQGSINNEPDSIVVLSTCKGLWGVIAFNNGTVLGIWPLEGGDRSKRHPHVLFRVSTMQNKCGTTTDPIVMHNQLTHKRMAVREINKGSRQRHRLHSQRLFLELALIGDLSMMRQFNMSKSKALEYSLNMLNLVDLILRRDFNLQLGLNFAEFWTDDLIQPALDVQIMLDRLLDYTTNQLYKEEKEVTILMTANRFVNGNTMAAVPGSVCTNRAVAIIQSSEQFTPYTAAYSLVHSLGHILGLEHDSSQECAKACTDSNSHCVMSSQFGLVSSNNNSQSFDQVRFPLHFSSCSIGRLHSLLSSSASTHLQQCLFTRYFNSTARLFLCGNGILDDGEACDCGPQEQCIDPCCDPLNCQLRLHAQCAAHQTCCHQCQIRSAGHICRQVRSVCDVPEICDGRNGDCPSDDYLLDGTQCGIGENGHCWQGECVDAEAQCRELWGQGAKLGDQLCFDQNKRAVEYGNCGRDLNGNFMECAPENERCGLLQCKDGLDSPVLPNVTSFALQFAQDQQFIQCKVISNSMFALVRDGTSCGKDRICIRSICLPLVQLSPPIQCPSNNLALQCSGHGECTNTGKCLCLDSWTEPACDKRSIDGSNERAITVDRKLAIDDLMVLPHPRSKSNIHISTIPRLDGKILETATLVTVLLFIGLLLLMLLVCLLLCYRRKNLTNPYQLACGTQLKGMKMTPDELNNDQQQMNGKEMDSEKIGERVIKFGQMPSWREEKSKRKTNKRVYDALQRITEANEADSLSLKSRESSMMVNNCVIEGPFDSLSTKNASPHLQLCISGIKSPAYCNNEDDRRLSPSLHSPTMIKSHQKTNLFDPPRLFSMASNKRMITYTPTNADAELLALDCPFFGTNRNDEEFPVVPNVPRISNIGHLMHELDKEIENNEPFKNLDLTNTKTNPEMSLQLQPVTSTDSGNIGKNIRESPSLFSDPYRLNLLS